LRIVVRNRAARSARDGSGGAGATSCRRYHLFYALRADFRRRLVQDARDDYRRALELAGNESERSFLRRRIDEAQRVE
jgi:predicted RNA polymerase sigma factor